MANHLSFYNIGKEIVNRSNINNVNKFFLFRNQTNASEPNKVSFTSTVLSHFPTVKLPTETITNNDSRIVFIDSKEDMMSSISLKRRKKASSKSLKNIMKRMKTCDEEVHNNIVNVLNIKFDFGDSNKNDSSFSSSNVINESVEKIKQMQYSQSPVLKKQCEAKRMFKSQSEQCHYSLPFGIFKAFSAITYKNFKRVNEDKLRISINTDINCDLPSVNFFAIYDGHRGDFTSKYLKDNYHSLLLSDPNVFNDTKKAILSTFHKIETEMISKEEKSGSCALILVNVSNKLFIANIGDSRCVISDEHSDEIAQLSIDHKPSSEAEKERIVKNGGKIKVAGNQSRIIPSGLSVSRTIGDIDAKSHSLGGVSDIISSIPDIVEIDNVTDIDFIVLASDGIFDALSNKEIVSTVYDTLKEKILLNDSFDVFIESVVDSIVYKAIDKGAKDNLSVIFLCFENVEQLHRKRNIKKIKEIQTKLKVSVDECKISRLVVDKEIYVGVKNSSSISKKDVDNNMKNNVHNKKKGKISFTEKIKNCFCFCKNVI